MPLLIGGKTSVETSSSPVISNAGKASSSPAQGNRTPSVITTGASRRSPKRAANRVNAGRKLTPYCGPVKLTV